MLVSSFVALALSLAAFSHPLAVRQQEEPVVTTIWGSVDCNAGNPPGSDPMPCPPIPTSTVVTLSQTSVATPASSCTAHSDTTSVTPTLVPVSSVTTSSPPEVTTIWGTRDCNKDNKPGDPMKPCPPMITSTVVTLTGTASADPSWPTVQLPDPSATTTDVPPEVTTVWGSVDCNANNKPGDPMKPCPPMPTSTVITLTPASTSTTTDVPPEVTTIWGKTDCNANNGPRDPVKPCPPMPTSTVITLTPTPSSSVTTTTTSAPPEVTTIWGRTDCNANNGPRDPVKPCPPMITSTVITLSPSDTFTEPPSPTPDAGWR